MQRLMRIMGLRAIYRRPRISRPAPGQPVFPYLLERVKVTGPNQSLPPTPIGGVGGRHHLPAHGPGLPVPGGRYGLAQPVRGGLAAVQHPDKGRGQALEADFCVNSLTEALGQGRPQVFNTNQSSQFTSGKYTQVLHDHRVRISMDGKGRYADNIFVERLWRTVEYEEVYLKAYASASEAGGNWEPTSGSTTTIDRIRPCATGPRPRCSTKPSMFRRRI